MTGEKEILIGKKRMTSKKLNLLMNDAMAAVFDEIQKEDGITQAEVVRRSVAYYRILRDQKRKGGTVMLIDSNRIDMKELELL